MKTLKHVSIAVMMIVSLIVLMIGLGTTASAETLGELTYTVADGKITITDCSETATDVVIPSVIGEYPVTAINEDIFDGCTALTDVYYAGSEEEWAEFEFEFDNEEIRIHYDCTDSASHFNAVVTDPTCSENGYTTYSCVCGYSYDADFVEAAHSYESEIIKKATCIEKGDIRYTCENCDNTYVEENAIEKDAENHEGDKEIRDAKEATCVQDGYTGDTYCLGCEVVLEYGQDIDATGIHSYEIEVTISATCIATGIRTYTCSVCYDSYTESVEIDASNHVGETETREAVTEDCGNDGYTGDTYCLDCENKIAEGEVIPATGIHTYESEVTLAATCCSTGVRTYTCTVCDYSYEESIKIDANNHVGETEVRDAVAETCGVNGYTGDTYCKSCDALLETGDLIPATGNHSYVASVAKAATCCETGILIYTCSVCGDSYEETIEIDATNHAGGTEFRNAIAETCGKDGYEGDIHCLGCGIKLGDGAVIEATGKHNYESEVTLAATCCSTGVETFACTVCGYTYDETIGFDANNHVGETEIRDAKAANCIDTGYTGDVCCTSCDAVLEAGSTTPVETGMHKYSSEVTKASTCCETGVRTYTCQICKNSFTESIDKNPENHDGGTEERNPKPATCDKVGYTGDVYCKGCNVKIADGSEIEKIAHTETLIKGKTATCSATGLTDGKKCSECGTVTVAQKIIAKTDHTFGEWIVVNAPTVTEKGSEERACTVCKTKETRAVDKLSYTPGDVNGDKKVTAADARIVLRVSAKLEKLEGDYIKAADVNKDNKVTAADARTILRVSAKLESF